ncbi:MAG: (5-formylfuran-3-yl)methyl phosphate synthase, partial [Planctomycetaceae bacterium]
FRRWQTRLGQSSNPAINQVAVSYADYSSVNAPAPEEVWRLACETGCTGLLVDTYSKEGLSSFDFLSVENLQELRSRCHESNLFFALAGSISLKHLDQIKEVSPDIIAVRGSVCESGARAGQISAVAIHHWKECISNW